MIKKDWYFWYYCHSWEESRFTR